MKGKSSISLYQLKSDKVLSLKTTASTLDGVISQLPLGYYTTLRTYESGTRVLGFQTHLERLYVPAAQQGIQPDVSPNELRQSLSYLTAKNAPGESRLRLILSEFDLPGGVFLAIQPYTPPPEEAYMNGVSLLSAPLSRQNPRFKNTAFIQNSQDARRTVKENKRIFEVLLVHDMHILEGMTSNFFAVTNGKLVTAQNGILLGVTRRTILQLACEEGIPVEYRPSRLDEGFDEAFITSSSRGVIPVVSINGQTIGKGIPGEITCCLQRQYTSYVELHSEPIVLMDKKVNCTQ